jgi:hypothetical protein
MNKRQIVLSLCLLLSVVSGMQAISSAPTAPRQPFGLRLGMTEESVHRRLKKIATQKKEEREEEEGGEREIWILKHDAKLNYLITRFDEEHRLIVITVVALPQQLRYADIASLKEATKATDGLNYSYKWKMDSGKRERPYVVIARGSGPEFLTSYSLYFSQ